MTTFAVQSYQPRALMSTLADKNTRQQLWMSAKNRKRNQQLSA